MKKDYSKLKTIFESSKDDDMSRLERRKSSRLRIFLIWSFFVLLILLALSFLSWLIFGRGPKFTGDNVKLTIDAPQRISSGQDIIYSIGYGNFEGVPLRQSELLLKYPEGFVFAQASPKPIEGNDRWSLGTLPSGKSGKIEVKGKLIGEKESVKTATAILSYIPANFSSQFEKIESTETTIKESLISLKVEGPTNALAGDKVNYLVKIKNESNKEFSDVRLTSFYPEGVRFLSATPEASEDDNVWNFKVLAGQQEQEIKIEAEIASGVSDKLEFKWQLGIGVGSGFLVQEELKTVTDVVKGDLTLDLIVNGANETKAVNFGDTLNYSIIYKNNSDTRLSEFKVKLTISSVHLKGGAAFGDGILSFDTLRDVNNGVLAAATEQASSNIMESKSITWTKKEVKNLTFLDPDEEGTLNLTVKLKGLEALKAQSGIGNLDDLAVESAVEMSIGKTGNLPSTTVVKSNTIISALNTNVKLSSEGRYFDDNGQSLGSGPLPPQVGRSTNYRIFWTVKNDLHEVKDIAVFAVLPKEVEWTNKFDIGAGEISYNRTSLTVTWKINRLPLSVPVIKSSFEVSFTPTKEQVGNIATILPRSVLTAVDSQTLGKLTQSAQSITTELESDARAGGKGIIVQGLDLIR